jgi:hypothetical protein
MRFTSAGFTVAADAVEVLVALAAEFVAVGGTPCSKKNTITIAGYTRFESIANAPPGAAVLGGSLLNKKIAKTKHTMAASASSRFHGAVAHAADRLPRCCGRLIRSPDVGCPGESKRGGFR